MSTLLGRASACLLVIGLAAGAARATDLRVLIQGPVTGGDVEFGIHDDFLQGEGCGGTCFAPAVCQVTVSVAATDTPVDVATALAAAIVADPVCQSMGFTATGGDDGGGNGLLRVQGPRHVDFDSCVNFWHLSTGDDCCPTPSPTPGGSFLCVSAVHPPVPALSEVGLLALAVLTVGGAAWTMRRRAAGSAAL